MSYCYRCGNQIREGAQFCSNCGAKAVTGPAVTQNTQPEPAVQSAVIENKPIPNSASAIGDKDHTMRKAYMKGGFGFLALMLIAQAIGSFVAIIAVISALIPEVLKITPEEFAEDFIQGGFAATIPDEYVNLFIVSSLIGSALGLIVGMLIMKRIRGKAPAPEKKNLSFGGFVIFAGISFFVWVIGVLIGNFPTFIGENPTSILDEATGFALIFELVYSIIGAPIIEELACRKIVIDGLRPHGETVAVFVSALFFGILHGNSGQFFLATFLGIVFATCYIKTGRIIYTMILHFMINFTASIPSILSLFGVDDTALTIIQLAIFGVVFVFGLIVLLTRRKSDLLVIQKPEAPNANRDAFKNPGMIVSLIAGLVMLVAEDATSYYSKLLLMLNNAAVGSIFDSGALIAYFVLGFVPTLLAIGVTIVMSVTVGKHTKPPAEEPPEDTPEDQANEPVCAESTYENAGE